MSVLSIADMRREQLFARLDGKRVLVTGGAGAIGSRLAAAVATTAERVTIIDDLSSGFRWNLPRGENVDFICADILDDRTAFMPEHGRKNSFGILPGQGKGIRVTDTRRDIT